LRDLRLFVDASTSWGVGLTIGESWFALPLRSCWKRDGIDICWLEAVAIELSLLFLVQLGYHDVHVLIHSDNKGAIGAHGKGRSRNTDINLCARRSFAITSAHVITPNLVYVPSALNIADFPSRGLLPPGFLPHNRLVRLFPLPDELRSVFGDDALSLPPA
jgi:hypothetical protein